MQAYVIRRILLMIPTFLGISLVIFAVLNFAPGRPGKQQSADFTQSTRGVESQESYRIFREQFDLDKPVLLNTRFTLTEAEVRAALDVVTNRKAGTSREKIAAQDDLEDWGRFAIPHLVAVLRSAGPSDHDLRDAAVYFLRLCAIRPLVDPYATRPTAEQKEQNRAIDAENSEIRQWRYAPEAPEEEKERVRETWLAWFDARNASDETSLSAKMRILFFETRFARYWQNLSRLDFGVSLVSREPVVRTLVGKLKYSLTLSVGSLLLAYALSIPLGIFSAVKKDTRADRIVTTALFMLYSLPTFFVATALLFFLSGGSDWQALRLFPTGGFQSPGASDLTTFDQLKDIGWHLVLPMFCLTYGSLAAISRYMRSGLLDVIRSDFIRTARAKGLSERSVIGKHALRNGLLPILTLLAGLLPAILGGSVIVEYIFGIPGMGLWVVDSIYQRDYNVIMAVELVTTVLVLVGILLTDLSYALVDPRIRFE